jgi:signal recognition particle subunit SRP54
MCVGLQGSGKTTLCSKLAYLFREKKEKVLLVSLDPYRPGAQEQLRILAEQVGVDVLPVIAREDVRDTAKRALAHRKTYDRIIFDTAGRLHIDQALMKELHDLDKIIQAKEVLLVCDSLMGQSVKDVVEAFSELPLSGVALSKLDANHKAGILLSLKFLLKKPVKVLGTGEKPEDVMAWDAKRLVGRILDQGDIAELVQRTTQAVSLETQEKQLDRLKQGIFTLDDLITQLDAMNKMGGLNTILKFIPGMRNVSAALEDKDTSFKKEKAMLSSMTSKERKNPKILNASRKVRIAKGSGTQVSDLNQLLSRFEQMKKMLQQFSKLSR